MEGHETWKLKAYPNKVADNCRFQAGFSVSAIWGDPLLARWSAEQGGFWLAQLSVAMMG
jgi:hypothetical protein